MGRELKRVALDFDWPLRTVWKGYISPYSPTSCKSCDGSGLNPETKKISDDWYALDSYQRYAGWRYRLEQDEVDALVSEGRLMDFTRRPRTPEQVEQLKQQEAEGKSGYWLQESNGYQPTAAEVNEWAKKGFGHDAINQHICVRVRAERLGVYGLCSLCDGNGKYWCDDKYEKLAEEWEPIEPPAGEGYQVWETVTEGSPVSPVFEKPEDLAEWMASNDDSVTRGTSKEKWLARLRVVLTEQAPSLDEPLPQPKAPPESCGAAVDRANARSESLRANLREMSDALRQCGGWLEACEQTKQLGGK